MSINETNCLFNACGKEISALVQQSEQYYQKYYSPGRIDTQPLHTVYIPPDCMQANVIREWSEKALQLWDYTCETSIEFTPVLPESTQFLGDNHSPRDKRNNWVYQQLSKFPICDLRIDFEDGYGHRSDEEEKNAAQRIAGIIEKIYTKKTCEDGENGLIPPRWLGVRTKGFVQGEYHKIIDTLAQVMPALHAVRSHIHPIITFPKIRDIYQVHAANAICEGIESVLDLPPHSVCYELQIETPQAIIGAQGECMISQFITLAGSRLIGLPFGTYDYTAALGIASAFQSLDHPGAHGAKNIIQTAIAGRNIWMSDGSTQVFPLGEPDRIRWAMQRHYRLVFQALGRGIYQGWDMHPGQLITRLLANYDFFQYAFAQGAARLETYCARLGGDITDEPATAESLAGVIARGVDLGIISTQMLYEQIPHLGKHPRDNLARIIARRPISEN